MAKYYRAYMADILLGFADWKDVDQYDESDIPIVLFTDCESFYDNLKKDRMAAFLTTSGGQCPSQDSEEPSAQNRAGTKANLSADGLSPDGSWPIA